MKMTAQGPVTLVTIVSDVVQLCDDRRWRGYLEKDHTDSIRLSSIPRTRVKLKEVVGTMIFMWVRSREQQRYY